MDKIILINLKKSDKKKILHKLCHKIVKDFSKLVCKYKVDYDTPSNKEECAALEETKFKEFKATFKEEMQKLQRITNFVDSKIKDMYTVLDMRRGYLYHHFADLRI
eukprot:3386167-Ditylum_brightwellii.AAC.1